MPLMKDNSLFNVMLMDRLHNPEVVSRMRVRAEYQLNANDRYFWYVPEPRHSTLIDVEVQKIRDMILYLVNGWTQ